MIRKINLLEISPCKPVRKSSNKRELLQMQLAVERRFLNVKTLMKHEEVDK